MHRRSLLAVQFCFTALAAVALLQVWVGDGLGSLYLLAAAYAVHFLWAGLSWRAVTGRWLDGYTLFLLSLSLFSGGQLLLYAAGLLPDRILENEYTSFSTVTLERTSSLVLCAVCCFHLGALLCARRMKSEGPFNVALYRQIGVALTALGGIGAIAELSRRAALVVSQGYMAIFQERGQAGLGNWDGFLAALFVPGLLIILATTPRAGRLVWAAALVHAAANMFLGRRGQAMLALVPMLLVQHTAIRPLSRKVIAALGVGCLVVLPLIAQLRVLSLADRIEAGRDVETAEILTAGLKEMGNSMATVAHTIEVAGRPPLREHEWGMGYLRAATVVIPNLLWDVHPAVAKGTYADWLTWEMHPEWAVRGGGIGFSMVAEAFLNFSWWGAPLFFLLAGGALGWLVSWARSRDDRLFIAVEAVILSSLLFWPRAEASAVLRPIVWCGIIPVLLATGRGRQSHRSQSPSPSESYSPRRT